MQTVDVAAALAAALQRDSGQPGQVLALQRLTGGATKQTWSLDWASDGETQALICSRRHRIGPRRVDGRPNSARPRRPH